MFSAMEFFLIGSTSYWWSEPICWTFSFATFSWPSGVSVLGPTEYLSRFPFVAQFSLFSLSFETSTIFCLRSLCPGPPLSKWPLFLVIAAPVLHVSVSTLLPGCCIWQMLDDAPGLLWILSLMCWKKLCKLEVFSGIPKNIEKLTKMNVKPTVANIGQMWSHFFISMHFSENKATV